MKTITPVEITKKRKLSLNFEKKGDETFLRVGDKSISVLEIYNQVKNVDRFRGAIIYSSEQFKSNLKEVSAVIAKHFKKYKLLWAMKSAALAELVNAAAEVGSGFDVGSSEEMKLAIDAGAKGENISHTAPAKFDWDIDNIVKYGCVAISDNPTEIGLLNERAKSLNKIVKVGIRLNPATNTSTAQAVSTGRFDCKFGWLGLTEEHLKEIKSYSNVGLCALHMHIGHQTSEPGNYQEALKKIIEAYKRLTKFGFKIETIDVGGGFPYNYCEDDSANDEMSSHAFLNHVKYDFEDYVVGIKKALVSELGEDLPTIAFEPGHLLTAGTAFALGFVLNTKEYPNGLRWVMSSISVNDLWTKAILSGKYYNVYILNPRSNEVQPTSLGGTLCFSGDIITPSDLSINLPKDIRRNDVLLINNVGAYSILGSGNFHNMPRLPIYVIDRDLNLKRVAWPKD